MSFWKKSIIVGLVSLLVSLSGGFCAVSVTAQAFSDQGLSMNEHAGHGMQNSPDLHEGDTHSHVSAVPSHTSGCVFDCRDMVVQAAAVKKASGVDGDFFGAATCNTPGISLQDHQSDGSCLDSGPPESSGTDALLTVSKKE